MGARVGRLRIIDRDSVLCAAERVVSRHGAARLTIEAVAAEAGISKASVLYDYKTKKALIKAVIERRMKAECARLSAAIEEAGPGPDRAIRGRMAVAKNRSMSDTDRAAALNLIAALAQDEQLRRPMQEAYRQEIAEIMETSTHPRGALLAFLALEGLKLLECFGIYSWPENERKRLFSDISALLSGEPAAVRGEANKAD